MDSVRVGLRGMIRAAQLRRAGGPAKLFIDIDGTLTDGLLYIDANGSKLMKAFSADDSDAIRELKWKMPKTEVSLITADHAARGISSLRADAMGIPCTVVPGKYRAGFMAQHERVVYIGDGWYDNEVFCASNFGIATANALPHTKKAADAVLSRRGGDKAVAQAIRFITKNLT